MNMILIVFCLFFKNVSAQNLPPAPTDKDHPGSQIYDLNFERQRTNCLGRNVDVFLPSGAGLTSKATAVVFGHGQALSLANYQGTFEHLAKKGMAVIFPQYSNGFFDQDWTRMGRDYVQMADCALKAFSQKIDNQKIVFAGHSKGAYVASVAAGLVENLNVPFALKATLLFGTAGVDQKTMASIPEGSTLTVVFSDADTIVDRKFSEEIFNKSSAEKKQFIVLKSYGSHLRADHFWPLTRGSAFGGGNESAFHYYGLWKWLVAAVQDVEAGSPHQNPYLYGPLAVDKGLNGLEDEIRRTGF